MHQSSIFGFFISRYKYTLLERNYQVVLRTGDFVDFIGFDKAIITKASNGTKLPNITRSVDNIFIQSNVISDSVISGDNSDILYRFSVDNLPLRYPFHIEPKRSLFSNICSNNIRKIHIHLTDTQDRPIDLNNIQVSLILILKGK